MHKGWGKLYLCCHCHAFSVDYDRKYECIGLNYPLYIFRFIFKKKHIFKLVSVNLTPKTPPLSIPVPALLLEEFKTLLYILNIKPLLNTKVANYDPIDKNNKSFKKNTPRSNLM